MLFSSDDLLNRWMSQQHLVIFSSVDSVSSCNMHRFQPWYGYWNDVLVSRENIWSISDRPEPCALLSGSTWSRHCASCTYLLCILQYLFVLQKAVSCVFCSQNMQYFGHDGPSAGEPLFPLETFDWPRPVTFYCFSLLAVNPDPSLPYIWFVALRPESLTMRYGLFSPTSVCSTRVLCVEVLWRWWDLSSGLACFLTYCAFSSMFTRLV